MVRADNDWHSRLFRLFLGPDPERQMNLKITLSGQLGYLANLGLAWYCVHNGLMNPALGWPISLALIATLIGFYLAIRLGWSRRLSDPSLTVPQMLMAAVMSAVGYVAAPAIHITLLMPVAVTLAFSVFSLKGRQVVVVQTFTTLLFCLTSAVMCQLQPEFYQPDVEMLVMGILVSAVLMLTWTGSQVAALRSRQRRQREALTQMLARIEEMAARDTLTGLANRRQMSTLLAHHVERVQRSGPPLTVAILDLDHFKQVNDTHGHAAGDEVLQAFARTAQAGLSGAETIARWGGEEFLLFSTAAPQSVAAHPRPARRDTGVRSGASTAGEFFCGRGGVPRPGDHCQHHRPGRSGAVRGQSRRPGAYRDGRASFAGNPLPRAASRCSDQADAPAERAGRRKTPPRTAASQRSLCEPEPHHCGTHPRQHRS